MRSTTPRGARSRSTHSPFGRLVRSTTSPTGSGRAATSRTARARWPAGRRPGATGPGRQRSLRPLRANRPRWRPPSRPPPAVIPARPRRAAGRGRAARRIRAPARERRCGRARPARPPPAPARRSLVHHQVVPVHHAVEEAVPQARLDLTAAQPGDAPYLVGGVHREAPRERMPVERYDLDRIALSEAAAHLAHARRQQALLAFEESGPRPVVDPQLAARLEVQHPPLPEPQALSLGKDQRPDVLAVEQPLQRPR